MVALATEELSRIGIIDAPRRAGLDGAAHGEDLPGLFRHLRPVRRNSRARRPLCQNLFLIGRNGMHRYNNQDHSMLTAMMAVDDIIAGKTDKNRPLGGQYRDGLSRGKGQVRAITA